MKDAIIGILMAIIIVVIVVLLKNSGLIKSADVPPQIISVPAQTQPIIVQPPAVFNPPAPLYINPPTYSVPGRYPHHPYYPGRGPTIVVPIYPKSNHPGHH